MPVTEQALQEAQLEVVEAGEPLEAAIMEAAAVSQDPIHKMLALQMQQVELLRKQLQAKQSADPIQNLLGGDGAISSGGTNIKGCLAREAYVKLSADLVKMASVGESNAATDLGLQPSQVIPGLLQDYMEKRIPLADQKLLTQMGYLMCHAYEVGARTGNKALQGFGVKGMMFVEQASLDGGRTGLAWLLVGLPEPRPGFVHLIVVHDFIRSSKKD